MVKNPLSKNSTVIQSATALCDFAKGPTHKLL